MVPILISALVGLISIGFLFLVRNLLRTSQSQQEAHFKSLQENFEAMQRNLLFNQKEFERTADSKNAVLRTELSQELSTNRKELQTGLLQSTQVMESRVTALDRRLEERLKDISDRVSSKLEENVKEGFKHFEKVQEHLKGAEQQLSQLNVVGQSINDLNNLLKLPHLRGGFGEGSLERLLADFLPTGSFELQYQISRNSAERVDAIIRYPNFVLPIDSKFPREAVIALFETNDPSLLAQARKQLYDVVKGLARQIKEKYIKPEHGTSEMALLFVPSETLYFEIIRDQRLGEELSKQKVFVVSPNTLAITLQSISIAKTYYEMSKGVEKTISDIRKARQHFEHFEKKFDEVGNTLGRAQTAYTAATTHLSRYESAVTRLIGTENVESSEGALLQVSSPPPELNP